MESRWVALSVALESPRGDVGEHSPVGVWSSGVRSWDDRARRVCVLIGLREDLLRWLVGGGWVPANVEYQLVGDVLFSEARLV